MTDEDVRRLIRNRCPELSAGDPAAFTQPAPLLAEPLPDAVVEQIVDVLAALEAPLAGTGRFLPPAQFIARDGVSPARARRCSRSS